MRPIANELDDVAQVAVDVVVQFQVAIGLGRLTPVDQIGVEAGLYEVRDDAFVGEDVENVRSIDQREDKHQRRPVLDRSLAGIV